MRLVTPRDAAAVGVLNVEGHAGGSLGCALSLSSLSLKSLGSLLEEPGNHTLALYGSAPAQADGGGVLSLACGGGHGALPASLSLAQLLGGGDDPAAHFRVVTLLGDDAGWLALAPLLELATSAACMLAATVLLGLALDGKVTVGEVLLEHWALLPSRLHVPSLLPSSAKACARLQQLRRKRWLLKEGMMVDHQHQHQRDNELDEVDAVVTLAADELIDVEDSAEPPAWQPQAPSRVLRLVAQDFTQQLVAAAVANAISTVAEEPTAEVVATFCVVALPEDEEESSTVPEVTTADETSDTVTTAASSSDSSSDNGDDTAAVLLTPPDFPLAANYEAFMLARRSLKTSLYAYGQWPSRRPRVTPVEMYGARRSLRTILARTALVSTCTSV